MPALTAAPAASDPYAGSRHLARLCAARPELVDGLAASASGPLTRRQLLDWLAEEAPGEGTLNRALRRLKQRAYVHVAARDLGGRAKLAEVTESMTLIAEVTLESALATLTATAIARYGTPRNERGEAQQLIVIGMGKLGGRELNVSSDIDLIFIYPEDGECDGAQRISNFEFFTRLGRQLIQAISDSTADGRVFRVDMRLRPDGDSGPLVGSFDLLERYFLTQGREWERYAWIKARPLSGDRHEELEAIRRPFVFRKYLDYGAIRAMRELHAQIRREVARSEMTDNIKLGPGGIREIEFIAQVFQLIRGGRDATLQIKPTLAVLALLAERGVLDAEATRELTSAYDFLRRLEHRLQYLDDAQTHSLPTAAEDRAIIARAMGYGGFDALLAELDDHRGNVSRHFEAVFADPDRGKHALADIWRAAADGSCEIDRLDRLGFTDGAAVADRLSALHNSNRYRQMAEATRSRFDALVPRLIEAASALPNPDQTLARGLDLFEAVTQRAAYLALLHQYPQALQKVALLSSRSSWAAHYLQRHPVLLDELLDPRLLEAAPDWAGFRDRLVETLDAADADIERQMDLMREAHHGQVFRLLVQDISGRLTVERLADHLSALADLMLDVAIARVWRKLPQRLGKGMDDAPRFAVISYGKLGGKELGYASDLDLVFIFDDATPGAIEVYSRLATRLNTWLSAQTAAGRLFDTDLRLRPNGEAGQAASSLAAFRQYQMESAWVWEHQALTRARFSAGDPALGAAFEALRREVLQRRRDLAELRDEVLAMREKMFVAHGGKNAARFDLKHDRGGLIDLEFIVQYLVLGHAHDHPELCGNLGNIALLGIAARLGLIPADLAAAAADAYRELRRLQHGLRLNDAQRGGIEPALAADAAGAVRRLWQHVFQQRP